MHCPGCGGTSSKKINEDFLSQQLHLDILSSKFDIFECDNCGLVFKWPMPHERDLVRYYQTISDDFWIHDEIYPHEKRIRRQLNSLSPGRRVLDIGCGTGELLRDFVNVHSCFGIEANPKAVEVAEKHGIKVVGSWITSDLQTKEMFDVIIMIDIFEHLAAPTHVLKGVVKMLNPGGKLIVVTGTTDSFPFNWLGPHYWYFKLAQHIVFLNKKYLRWLTSQIPGYKITYQSVAHYKLDVLSFLADHYSILKWSFFSPLSKFSLLPRKVYSKQLGFKILKGWKDHYIIEIQREK